MAWRMSTADCKRELCSSSDRRKSSPLLRREVIQGVISFLVQERQAIGRTDAGRMEFVNVAFLDLADVQADALAVGPALVSTIDLFQKDAHDRAVCLVADEELFLEWAELAAGQIAVDTAGGLAHLLVGK